MTEQPATDEDLVAKLTNATVTRAEMAVASEMAVAVFARTKFLGGEDLKVEMLKLYRFFRQNAEPGTSSHPQSD